MKKALKRFLRYLIKITIDVAINTSVGRYLFEQVLNVTLNRTTSIHHNGLGLTFSAPNSMNHFRAKTFSTKEPETLEWIDGMEPGAVVWDVGANVGLYSCYAAKHRGCTVFAFEPSVFNLEILVRNVHLNELADRVTLVPLALTDCPQISTLNMSMTEWGGSMSTFGESYTHDGNLLRKVFEFRTLGFSMDDATGRLGIPLPDYIKLDVDGIEHLILKGGTSVLSSVKGVLIEVNENFARQAEDSFRYLTEAGLELVEKHRAAFLAEANVSNQIWHRKTWVDSNGL